jgi:hypothetical protein
MASVVCAWVSRRSGCSISTLRWMPENHAGRVSSSAPPFTANCARHRRQNGPRTDCFARCGYNPRRRGRTAWPVRGVPQENDWVVCGRNPASGASLFRHSDLIPNDLELRTDSSLLRSIDTSITDNEIIGRRRAIMGATEWELQKALAAEACALTEAVSVLLRLCGSATVQQPTPRFPDKSLAVTMIR